jgi:hypothetical protein
MTLVRAKALMEGSAFSLRVEGEGDLVISQLPLPATVIPLSGATLVLHLGKGVEAPKAPDTSEKKSIYKIRN